MYSIKISVVGNNGEWQYELFQATGETPDGPNALL
jgi:hypothetical protein